MRRLLFLLLLCILLVFVTSCSSTPKISVEQLKNDLTGKEVSLDNTDIHLKLDSNTIKNLNITDQKSQDNNISVMADLTFDFLSKHTGSLNGNYLINNDIHYSGTGRLIATYEKYDKAWRLMEVSFDNQKVTSEETQPQISIPVFNKESDTIINDLKNSDIDLNFSFENSISTISINFSKPDKYIHKFQKINNLELIKIEKYKDSDLMTAANVNIDFDFYYDNFWSKDFPSGNYNCKGDLGLIYKIKVNPDDSAEWVLSNVNYNNYSTIDTFEIRSISGNN